MVFEPRISDLHKLRGACLAEHNNLFVFLHNSSLLRRMHEMSNNAAYFKACFYFFYFSKKELKY